MAAGTRLTRVSKVKDPYSNRLFYFLAKLVKVLGANLEASIYIHLQKVAGVQNQCQLLQYEGKERIQTNTTDFDVTWFKIYLTYVSTRSFF